ncbi:MAG: NAD-dependent epimerase/dehydratase family protein [Magnetococcales bacterium]|nr:NAD-dependent epimerase/dehydratase family protein [Magnetococcales bacterium]
MRIVVTGGAGFIGSHLVDKLLARGHEVIVIDRFLRGNKLTKEAIRHIRLVEGDVRDGQLVREITREADLIFHLAAYLGVDIVADHPLETMETEAIGMKNIANAAVINGIDRIVYASTSGVYGKAAIEMAVDEDFQVAPNSSYAIAKRYNEIYLQSLFKEKQIQCFSLRYFNVYGPRQDTRMVLPRFFKQAMEGTPLTVFGQGLQTRDFTYIDDVVEASIRVSEAGKGCEIVNIARGEDIPIAELAKTVIAVTGSTSQVHFLEPPPGRYDFEVQRRCGSSEKMTRMTGYALETPLHVGLKHTFEYIKEHWIHT